MPHITVTLLLNSTCINRRLILGPTDRQSLTATSELAQIVAVFPPSLRTRSSYHAGMLIYTRA